MTLFAAIEPMALLNFLSAADGHLPPYEVFCETHLAYWGHTNRWAMAKELKIQAIDQAQAGNMKTLAAVAEQVRLTLDYYLAQDLTQETVLEMITSPIISLGFFLKQISFCGMTTVESANASIREGRLSLVCGKKTICCVVVLVWATCSQASAEPFAKGPYLGQTPPGSTAQVFAPGLICETGPHQWESHGSFSADGNTFCYARVGGVFITENTDQGWTVPQHVESVPDMTFSACVSPDANSIYFMYSYDRSKPYHPFRCQRTSNGWSWPQELEPFFSRPRVAHGGFSLAADNSIYIFTTWPEAGGRKRGTFLAPYVNKTWARAIKLSVDGGAPGIAPDASFMVFNAGRPEGLGAIDLYLTLRQPGGTWSEARNLGRKINSRHFEFGARISPDKKYLFFTRANGWGENSSRDTADIYWVALKEYLPESYR